MKKYMITYIIISIISIIILNLWNTQLYYYNLRLFFISNIHSVAEFCSHFSKGVVRTGAHAVARTDLI